jgi:hypothetical protein
MFIGGKPMYGYKMDPNEKNRIIVDEEVAPIVRRIFAMALAGESCRQIAATLNAEKIPTPATYAGWAVGHPGAFTGMWSSERISEMLQNETYTGNMVQGRQVKVNYKSKKCIRQPKEKWVVVENTHEPLIDRESFQKVQMLVGSRRRTRSRTYDSMLRGYIFCHECGYPLALANRPTRDGKDCMYYMCRTYQRFTKAGVCTCHSIKEETVNRVVIDKVREVCRAYLDPARLESIAAAALAEADQTARSEAEIQALRKKSDTLTANLDRMYMDRLSGLLAEADFERIYQRTRAERSALEEKIGVLKRQAQSAVPAETRTREIVQRFLDSAFTSRELLVSLIERIEYTADRQIIIKFRFRELETLTEQKS